MFYFFIFNPMSISIRTHSRGCYTDCLQSLLINKQAVQALAKDVQILVTSNQNEVYSVENEQILAMQHNDEWLRMEAFYNILSPIHLAISEVR